jgi:hypothetical protein
MKEYSRLVVSPAWALIMAKEAVAAHDVDECICWINYAMKDSLLDLTQRPMFQAGLGKRNLIPDTNNSVQCQLFEFGESVLKSLKGEEDASDYM